MRIIQTNSDEKFLQGTKRVCIRNEEGNLTFPPRLLLAKHTGRDFLYVTLCNTIQCGLLLGIH